MKHSWIKKIFIASFFIVVFLSPLSNVRADITSSFLGHWTFDTTNTNWGTNTTSDTSSNGYNGTLTNFYSATSTVVGQLNQGLYFDGVDDKVSLPTSVVGSSITLSAWIKPAVVNKEQRIINYHNRYRLELSDNGKLYCAFHTVNQSWNFCSTLGNTTLVANRWYHVAVTYDGSSTYTYYLNGVANGSNSSQFTGALTGGSLTPCIGDACGDGNTTAFFKGSMDDVNIYSRALSSGDMLELYTSAFVPTITTSDASSITATTATLNGSIDVANAASSTIRGFAYGTSATLSTVIATTTESGIFDSGAFTSAVSGLTGNTTYYVRAYASNATSTGYGTIKSFTTSVAVVVPTVTVQSASSITATMVTLNGTMTSDGNASSTVRGFAYGTDTSYSLGTTTENGTFAIGSFTSSISSLTCNTTYHVRAYSTNSAGTGFSGDQTFLTSPCVPGNPTSVVAVAGNGQATISFTIPGSDGGSTILYYTASSTPGTQAGYGTSPITVSGLSNGTTYTFTVTATNAVGTSTASSASNSITPSTTPTITTSDASSITATTATLNGSIDALGGASVTDRGFEWGTNNAYGNSISTNGSYSVGTYNADLSGLTCNTEYHVRAFATNSVGTASSSDSSFTTSACPVSSTPSSSSGSSSGGGGRSGFVQILPTPSLVTKVFDIITPSFLKPKVVPAAVAPIIEIKNPLDGSWKLLPQEPVKSFVLAPLPEEVLVLTAKFPELEKTFKTLGITKVSDLGKLKNASINLPNLSARVGANGAVPIGSLTPDQKKMLPTEVVFARSGTVDYNVGLTVNNGNPEQQVKTIVGKPLDLAIKADKPVKEIKGYLTVKNIERKSVSRPIPSDSMLASVVAAILPTPHPRTEGVEVEQKLVLQEFNYSDDNNDGIYTAQVQTPLLKGEYDIISVMQYRDIKLGSKEFHLTTVVDPEGYIYRDSGNGEETRIHDATVTIFQKNLSTSDFELWPANNFQQTNPQLTDKSGTYSFLVPEGIYKITVSAPGYEDYIGSEFSVVQGGGVHTNIVLKPKGVWNRFLRSIKLN